MPGGEGSWEAACSVSVGLDRCSTVLATVELEGGAVVAVLLVLLGQSIGGAPLMVTEERRVGYDGEETLTGLFDEDQKKNVQVLLSLESKATPPKKKALLNPRAICGCKLLLVSKPSYAFLLDPV